MFEITFDIPVIWLLLGLSMIYITAALSRRMFHWRFQQKYCAKSHDNMEVITEFPPILIVKPFIFTKRKIPNFRDRSSQSDDEDSATLLLN